MRFFSGMCPNESSRPYLHHIYEVPLKLVCLMSLTPMYFAVERKVKTENRLSVFGTKYSRVDQVKFF